MTVSFRTNPGGCLRGKTSVPGDKSISHRAVMLGALAEGQTDISGFLNGEDCLSTLKAFNAMGIASERRTETALRIQGAGLRGLKAPAAELDLGNSGTSMRLMAGILAGQTFSSIMTGDASLQRRPMQRVTMPLRQMGAEIETTEAGTAPLRVHGGRSLRGIQYHSVVASAQVKSSLLLAGLYAEGETEVFEPAPSRDHTERMLRGFGYAVGSASGVARLQGGGRLRGQAVAVPGDISSAAFFLVGAAISPGSDLVIDNVGVNPTRTGVIEILRLMGATVEVLDLRESSGEPVASLRIRGCALKGICIPEELVPLAIDEFPALFIAAACAEGETLLTGAEELRVKESDRIAVMAQGLRALGITADPSADGIRIQGGALRGGRIDSHGDHRVAMAFSMAALRATEAIVIDDCSNVNTSFPGFAELAAQTGLDIRVQGA